MTPQTDIADRLAFSMFVGARALALGCPRLPAIEEPLSFLDSSIPELDDEDPVPAAALGLDEAYFLSEAVSNSLVAVGELSDKEDLPTDLAHSFHLALDEIAAGLGAAIRREKADRVRGLYVIIDPEVTLGRDPMQVASGALRGGAKMLQLRDKLRDKGEMLDLAFNLQALCEEHGALLIVNDHADVASAVLAGGVHVGQTDLPVSGARKVLKHFQVLGRSNREIPLLIESQEMGADHVAFGAIYQTTTKPGGRGPQGPERLKEARAVTKVPLVAIGGITAENVAPVVDYGADAVCVTAAVGLAQDPEAAATRLVEAIHRAGGKV